MILDKFVTHISNPNDFDEMLSEKAKLYTYVRTFKYIHTYIHTYTRERSGVKG